MTDYFMTVGGKTPWPWDKFCCAASENEHMISFMSSALENDSIAVAVLTKGMSRITIRKTLL